MYEDLSAAVAEGKDPYLWLASQKLGIAYDEAVNRYKNGDLETRRQRGTMKMYYFGWEFFATKKPDSST